MNFLPDDIVLHIYSFVFQDVLEELKMAISETGERPIVLYYAKAKTFCEVCEKDKENVAWFLNSFRFYERSLYSACPFCMGVSASCR